MKKILMIGTGGTIASEMTPEGLTPELVSLLIDKVYVFPGKRIEIAYKVQDLFD